MARNTNPKNRKIILKEAHKLFQHYGFRKTTIEDIARECGIAKGSVYLHFSCKGEILKEIIENRMEEEFKVLCNLLNSANTPEEKLWIILERKIMRVHSFIKSAAHAEELLVWNWEPFCKEPPTAQMIQKHIDIIMKVIEKGVKDGVFFCDNPKLMAQHIEFVTYAFLPPYKQDIDVKFLKKHLKIYYNNLLAGLKSRQSQGG